MDTTEAIEGYCAAMRRRNLATSTIYARSGELRRFVAWLGDRSPWTVDRETLEAYLDDRALGPRATCTAISHLCQWYRWARRRGLVEADPTELVERPRLARRVPRPARHEQITTALLEADDELALMLALMVDGGLRCCEVARLRWGDVDLRRRIAYVTGKGDHERVIGLPDRLVRILAGLDGFHGPVIGRTMTAGRVSQIVNAYLQQAGVDATAHQLRHLYATRMLAATSDITAVQQALGHASVTSTQIYAAVDPVKALDAARRLEAHPS